MKTLYLRNVPDDVLDRLERLAQRENMSVSATAIRELAESSRRIENPELLGDLPDFKIDSATLLQEIDTERAHR